MKPPQDHSRRLLVAVTGLSPQIVTETLYALSVEQEPPFLPTEIHLITTEEGARRAGLSLLHPESGWFHRLRADYGLPAIAFRPDSEHIHVLRDIGDRPLGDIRTPEDNTRAADIITEVVRDLTRDGDSALHVSIAGGRKTMGFYLGYALSLYGREQDRLSHVLVSAPYESHREFFYPTPESQVIHTTDGTPCDTHDAKVTLADIPFVRLREGLNEELRQGATTFSAAVREAQRALPPLALVLNPDTCEVTASGETFKLTLNRFALYWMLAERTLAGRPGIHWRESCLRDELLRYYGRLVGEYSGDYERAEKAYGQGHEMDVTFNPTKTHVNKELIKRLGARRAEPYRIVRVEKIGPRSWRFGLRLPPAAIRIANGKGARHG